MSTDIDVELRYNMGIGLTSNRCYTCGTSAIGDALRLSMKSILYDIRASNPALDTSMGIEMHAASLRRVYNRRDASVRTYLSSCTVADDPTAPSE